MNKTALITGICGQDGSYLAEYLISKGYSVVGATKNIETDSKKNNIREIKDKIELINWPYSKQDKIDHLIEKINPCEIYNLAGHSSGEKMNFNPALYSELNAVSVVRILDSVNRINNKIKILQASSREIFGNPAESPQNELTLRNPRSIYGASKLYADNVIKIYRENMNIFSCSAILYNHESPRRKSEFITQKIVKGAVKIKNGLQKNLVLGNLDSVRDWGSAKDFVIAMHLILQNNRPEDYVIASGISFTVRNICEIVFDHLDLNYNDHIIVSEKSYRDNESLPLIGDIKKIKKNTGWRPKINFRDMIIEMIEKELRA